MVRQRLAAELDVWVKTCLECQVRDLRNFAKGILEDYDAVSAALATPWSNGQTEGQVNRLKLWKRQMYGRANLDLLRFRLLYAP
jgi:transposase